MPKPREKKAMEKVSWWMSAISNKTPCKMYWCRRIRNPKEKQR